MKKSVLLIWGLLLCSGAWAQSGKGGERYTILLSGASFATPNNGWFEFGCKALDAEAINRAVGGESIADCAQKMHDGVLYSPQELERIDALVIMQVHERDVFEDSYGRMKEKIEEYPFPFDRGNYAGAYDYVIKKYTADCYNLQFDPKSKYYRSPFGKPAVIVLCTHWHDSREVFNRTVRRLAEKWGLPLVEFDRLIGFSKNTVHPVTGKPYSQIYAANNQEQDGESYGWHPYSGDTYIQKRMAAIFVAKMKEILPLR